MEGNRDEANRCIEIAEAALADGKYEKATKFLKKAETLFPSARVTEFLAKVARMSSEAKTSSPHASPQMPRKRNTGTGAADGGTTTSGRSTEPDYTSDQLEAVKNVKKCRDYYEVLGITKEATDSEIKKAYKKLALQLHPDKNKAPGSVEAFKAVGNAVAVLTDPEKRKSYDMFGAGDMKSHGARGRGAGGGRQSYEFGYSRGFESDVTAEELFNMFFGGGMPQQNVFMQRQRRFNRTEQQQQREQQEPSYAALINLLPILILIFFTMMSSFFISDPIYSLTSSPKYSIARTTNALKVPYFVKENFHSEYQGSVGRLEISVEEEYRNNLRHSCYREKNYKDSMLIKARSFSDQDLYRKAYAITTPSCDQLQHIYRS